MVRRLTGLAACMMMGCLATAGCAETTLEYGTTGYVPQLPPPQSYPMLQGSSHTVRSGETLWRIAHSYGLEARVLAQANHLSENSSVTVGRRLFIPLPPETDRFVWPVRGAVNVSHGGIDIHAAMGSLVRASRSGRVAVATTRLSGWGNAVVMDHSDGSVTVYAGMEQIVTAPGMMLRQGMPLGRAGAQPIHFEIRRGIKPANALGLLPRQ